MNTRPIVILKEKDYLIMDKIGCGFDGYKQIHKVLSIDIDGNVKMVRYHQDPNLTTGMCVILSFKEVQQKFSLLDEETRTHQFNLHVTGYAELSLVANSYEEAVAQVLRLREINAIKFKAVDLCWEKEHDIETLTQEQVFEYDRLKVFK